jgi:tRNA threonylcarbamoyladenosine biosynthesis protein TsaE
VAALGSAAEVTSPTLSLVHEYRTAGPVVVHLDFYRLESPEELLAIGWDEMLESGAVVIAEWADKFPELMPEGTRWLRFSVEPDETRRVCEVPAISR